MGEAINARARRLGGVVIGLAAIAAVAAPRIIEGFGRSDSLGWGLVLVAPVAAGVAWLAVLLVMHLMKLPARRLERRLGRPAFTLTGQHGMNLQLLLDSRSAVPASPTVAATDSAVEFWWKSDSPGPFAVIPRDRITSIELSSPAALGRDTPAVVVHVDRMREPIRIAMVSRRFFSMGSANETETREYARQLGLEAG